MMNLRPPILILTLVLAPPAWADPSYVARSNNAITALLPTNPTASLPAAPGDCQSCHGPVGPPVGTFGQALINAAMARGYGRGTAAGWVRGATPPDTVFRDIYQDVLDLDPDGDGTSNRNEFIAKSNPGVAGVTTSSAPPNGPGDVVVLSPRNLNESAEQQDDRLLSGCGNNSAALGWVSAETQAGIDKHWLFGLLLFLPLFLATLLRQPRQALSRWRSRPTVKTRSAPPHKPN